MAKVPMIETGMATEGMMVERKLRRKTKMISTTRRNAMPSVPQTSLMALSTYTLASYATHKSQPAGSVGLVDSISERMAWATLTVLALACLTTPRNTQGLPAARAMVR